MTKMSIHRALQEIKLLDKKIVDRIDKFEPVVGTTKEKENSDTTNDFKKRAISSWDSITEMIDRRARIKELVLKSNSESIVTVGGKSMTLASAISYKDIINFKNSLSSKMRSQKLFMTSKIESHNANVEEKAVELAQSALGKNNVKIGDKDIASIVEPFIESREAVYVDPLKCDEKIEALEDEIALSLADLDAAISESNATTFIEV